MISNSNVFNYQDKSIIHTAQQTSSIKMAATVRILRFILDFFILIKESLYM